MAVRTCVRSYISQSDCMIVHINHNITTNYHSIIQLTHTTATTFSIYKIALHNFSRFEIIKSMKSNTQKVFVLIHVYMTTTQNNEYAVFK